MHQPDSTGCHDRGRAPPPGAEHRFDPYGPLALEERGEVEDEVKRLLEIDGMLGTGLGVAEFD